MDGCLSTVKDPRAGPCCSGGLHSPHHANTSNVLRSRQPRAGCSIRADGGGCGLVLLRRIRAVTSTGAVPVPIVGASLPHRTWEWCGKSTEYRTILTFYAPGRWDPVVSCCYAPPTPVERGFSALKPRNPTLFSRSALPTATGRVFHPRATWGLWSRVAAPFPLAPRSPGLFSHHGAPRA